MIRSMTAFGRGERTDELGYFLVELQSVNRKRLEVDVNLPRELAALEPPVRERLGRALGRGKITCTVVARLAPGEGQIVEPNEPLARMVKAGYERLREALGYTEPVAFEAIARIKEVLTVRNGAVDVMQFWPPVEAALDAALEQLMAMKQAEGEAIAEDFCARLDLLVEQAAAIEAAAPRAVERYRERLTERVRELAADLVDNEDRVVREVALMAEKLDVTEELLRLRSHVEQFRAYLNGDDPAVGRTLDFLAQEMHRELNTIGSKSAEIEVTNRVVVGKSELEKIREQVQNVE